MPSDIVVQVECPHCRVLFREAASLVRPHASSYCPSCGTSFALDPEIEAMSRLLMRAQTARKERKRRREELRELFGPVPSHALPAAPAQPATLSSILARLDAIAARMQQQLDEGGPWRESA